MKNLSKENVIIILLVGLIIHNIYLQILVEDTSEAAKGARSAASQAVNLASDAEVAAQKAAKYAEEALWR